MQSGSNIEYRNYSAAVDEEVLTEHEFLLEGYEGEAGELQELSEGILSSLPGTEEKNKLQNEEESSEFYNIATSLAKEIYNRVSRDGVLKLAPVRLCVEELVDQLSLGNNHLLVSMTEGSDDYFYNHIVNVCILSIKMGIGMGYDKAALTELGVSAFLHDTGMTKCRDMVNINGELSAKDSSVIRKHPFMSAELLENTPGIPDSAIKVALLHHERSDGSGYPRGLKGESLSQYSRIVAVADSYEALTHGRPFRERSTPYEAVQVLLKDKKAYDYQSMKTFIRMIGVYPVGSLVKLNTGETCRVTANNEGNPTRPVLSVLNSGGSGKGGEAKVVNLMKYPMVCIKESLKEDRGRWKRSK